MARFLQRLPLLLVAFIFLVVSASKTTDVTDALLAAGLVVLGAWVAVEVIRLWQQSFSEIDREPLDPIEEDSE